MSAQTTYNFSTPIGAAGGIVDLAPHAIDSFVNEENTGVMKFGVAVVTGTKAGKQVKLPADGATAATFEGIVTNRRTTEYDLEGDIHIRKAAALGVMKYGRIYGRLATGADPAYGKAVYFIAGGDEAGFFTDAADNGETGDDKVDNVAVKARFMGAADATTNVAEIELFNQAQV